MANLAVEMPTIAASSYASNTVDTALSHNMPVWPPSGDLPAVSASWHRDMRPVLQPIPTGGTTTMAAPARRLVQVFIADPDENVPLDQCLLYSGEQQVTDLTDQELFFEIDVRSILERHNAKRVALVNKSIKERAENLEPARVRDLRMTVVTIAQF